MFHVLPSPVWILLAVILCALHLKAIYHLLFRAAEGFLASVIKQISPLSLAALLSDLFNTAHKGKGRRV